MQCNLFPFRMWFLGAPEWLSWLTGQLLVSAQVTISWFVGSSPTSGSAMTMQCRTCLGFSLSASLSLLHSCALGFLKKKKKKKKKRMWFLEQIQYSRWSWNHPEFWILGDYYYNLKSHYVFGSHLNLLMHFECTVATPELILFYITMTDSVHYSSWPDSWGPWLCSST